VLLAWGKAPGDNFTYLVIVLHFLQPAGGLYVRYRTQPGCGKKKSARGTVEAIAMGPNILSSNTPKSNRLLAALPEENYRALLPVLEPVVLPLGKALYESGATQGYVYFPTSSIVSLLYVVQAPATASGSRAKC
jgi:hypothetical protein